MRLLRLGNLPLLSEVALIAALAWVVSGWLLPTGSPGTSALTPNIASQTTMLPDLAKLITVPLFGKINAQVQTTKPVVQAAKQIVVSPLKIKLLGTVVAEEHAAAIIVLKAGGEQRVFFIGDSIQPGVVLKTVEAEAIVVERGGKLERISLEQGAKLTVAPVARNNLVASPPTMSARTPVRTALPIPAQSMRKRMNRNHLQKQLQNFPALMSQARAIPHMTNGKLAGFTISEIAPGSLYQQAGLQNGDIILSVNGKRITDARQAMTMYQTLKSAAAIDLELIRAGQTRNIHYNIR